MADLLGKILEKIEFYSQVRERHTVASALDWALHKSGH
jgi:hypothetical protein